MTSLSHLQIPCWDHETSAVGVLPPGGDPGFQCTLGDGHCQFTEVTQNLVSGKALRGSSLCWPLRCAWLPPARAWEGASSPEIAHPHAHQRPLSAQLDVEMKPVILFPPEDALCALQWIASWGTSSQDHQV